MHARLAKGQSIDVAHTKQFTKRWAGTMVEYFQNGVVRERSGNRAQGFQPLDSFQASDGWVVMGAIGDVYSRMAARYRARSRRPEWETARHKLESIEGIEIRRHPARMDFRAHREGRCIASG